MELPGNVSVTTGADHRRLESLWAEVLSHRSAIESGCRAAGCTGAGLEDTIQESLLRAFLWVREPGAGETERGASWFQTLARRVGLNQELRSARRRERERRAARREARGSQDPESALQQREDRVLVGAALQVLPLAERQAIQVVVLEGRFVRAAARLLGRPRRRVGADLERGLAHLQSSMGREQEGMAS